MIQCIREGLFRPGRDPYPPPLPFQRGTVMIRNRYELTIGPAARSLGMLTAVVTLFTIYCQLTAISEVGGVPLSVSFSWALTMTCAWGLAGALIWLFRSRLLDLLDRRRLKEIGLATAAIFVLALCGVGIVFIVMHLTGGFGGELSLIPSRLIRFMPGSALAAGLLVSVALLHRHRAAQVAPDVQSDPSPWLSLPEEPQLAVRKSDVTLIRSAGNYCEIHARGRAHLVRVTLKTVAERLAGDGFVQVHRTAIVNVQHLRAVTPSSTSNKVNVHLQDGLQVPVGPSFVSAVRRIVQASPAESTRH